MTLSFKTPIQTDERIIPMKNLLLTVLGTIAALSLIPASAHANDWHSMPRHMGYHPAYEGNLTAMQWRDLRAYREYESREPCQNYRLPPMGFYRDADCDLMYRTPQSANAEVMPLRQQPSAPAVGASSASNILTTYKVSFAFDSAAIEPSSNATLDQIARELTKYDPREVAVRGYTDRAGTTDYNVKLSQRRAEAVSKALNDRSVSSRVFDKEAFGESNSAVDTKDGVPLRENRRVIIEFLK